MRLLVLLTASVLATAAPMRAWCEASCLSAAHQDAASAKPHCPTTDTTSGLAISAAGLDDCPVVESARPIQAKLDFALAALQGTGHSVTPRHPGTQAPRHPRTQAPRHPGFIPLRI
jgi:hypothetical protein